MADHPIEEFQEQYPSLDSYWRSIVLFGRNTASYKFALAESLMELAKHGQTAVTNRQQVRKANFWMLVEDIMQERFHIRNSLT